MSSCDGRVIKAEEVKPCGCHVVDYADGGRQVAPCVSCGLMEAARALGLAGQVLAAVATTVRRSQQEAMMAMVARKVVS